MTPDGSLELMVQPLGDSVDSAFASKGRNPGLSLERVRLAMAFINANLDSKLQWKRIASAVGMSAFYFGRGFKSTTGLTLHQYVTRCRIERATNLLASSDQSLVDIALQVGCCCQSQFTTLFRKHTGVTPGKFRASRRSHRMVMAAPLAAARQSLIEAVFAKP
jgi:AraC-like DNA-binding protein